MFLKKKLKAISTYGNFMKTKQMLYLKKLA